MSKDLPERMPSARYRILRWIGRNPYLPKRRRLVRLFGNEADRIPDSDFEVPFYGYRYRGRLARHIDWHVYFYGAYAPEELSLLERCIAMLRENGRSHIFCVDVGANAGHHTLFFARHADTVFAFEPFPPIRERLLQTISDNRIDHVRVFPYGLGERDRDLPFTPPPHENEGLGSFASGSSSLTLAVRNGSDILDQENAPKIDILKIDVEGFEASVFAGLSRRIKRDRPIILTEITGPSRAAFGDQAGISRYLYDDATFLGVRATRDRRTFQLKPYEFERDKEVLILPPEWASRWPSRAVPSRYEPGYGFR